MTDFHTINHDEYHKEAERLRRRYMTALGWCLQYSIPVHTHGYLRGLGELEDDIAAHEGKPQSFERHVFAALLDAENKGLR